MAAAIENETGIKATLKKGHDGIFEVSVNDKVIYERSKTGRFPASEEILNLLTGEITTIVGGQKGMKKVDIKKAVRERYGGIAKERGGARAPVVAESSCG